MLHKKKSSNYWYPQFFLLLLLPSGSSFARGRPLILTTTKRAWKMPPPYGQPDRKISAFFTSRLRILATGVARARFILRAIPIIATCKVFSQPSIRLYVSTMCCRLMRRTSRRRCPQFLVLSSHQAPLLRIPSSSR